MGNRFFFASRAINALVRRDFFSNLGGWGPYLAVCVAFLASSFLLKNYLGAIQEENILISSDPLNFPLLISLVVVSFYLAILSVVSISREKDQGTLEVLFYGPVNCASYLLAKFVADMLVYLVLLCFLILYFLSVSALTNLAFSWSLMKGVFLSISSVACVISFSLFISSLTSRMRSSIIGLMAILLVFLAIQVCHTMLLRLEQDTLSSSMITLRETLAVLSRGIEWISPFAYVHRGMQSIGIGSIRLYGMNIVYALVYAFVFLVLSVTALERKGVRA
jgi:ABC-type transport system involved in multi-copper enzyme maturation permease subunit